MMEDKLENTYRKLKSYLYHDKTLLSEKIKLSEFEENIKDNIKSLSDKIKNKNIDQLIENISYRLVPKKIKNEKEKEKSIYKNQTEKEQYEVESYNVFIDAPIEIHIISALWVVIVGEKLDLELNDSVYSNRLHRDKFNMFNSESTKLFKPYYQGYSNFRDNAISMALSLHKEKLDVTVLNIDIKEFFYNIGFDFSSIKDIEDEFSLNTLMQKIHDKYHDEVKELEPNINTSYDNKNFLPIGLVSSYVISNHILKKFDEYIVKDLKPEYYGRYVDDMLFVFSNCNKNLDSKYIVCELLNKKGVTKLPCGKKEESDVVLTIEKRKFTLQQKKVKIFHFYKNDSISLLAKFKSTIDENSSFFNFLPDEERLFNTLESSSFNIFYSDSENKISSLVGTSKDTLNISRNLASVMTVTAYADFDKLFTEKYNKQVKNVFKGKHIFELKLYWERVFSYLYINKKYKLFIELVKYFKETIEKIEHKQKENKQKEKLKKDCIEYLQQSILFAVATNPKYFKEKMINDLKKVNVFFEEYENPFKTIVSSIRSANMFNQNLVASPLINYTDIDDDFDLTSKKIELNGLDISKIKREFSPRFIHYHEVALFYHRIKMINIKRNYLNIIEHINEQYKDFNGNNIIDLPSIDEKKIIKVPSRDKETLKIGIVSIKLNLKDIEDAYTATPNLNYSRLKKYIKILNQSIEKNHKVDLLIFPEVSVPYVWVSLFAKFAKKNNIGIIFGVEHIRIGDRVSNCTCIMLPFKIDNYTEVFVNFESKKHFSPSEKIAIESRNYIANENKLKKEPTLYKWRGCIFSTFNCYELTDIDYRSRLKGKVDFVVAIEYNKDTNYFSNIIDSLSRDLHCYVIQVNTSDYGDSRIVKPSKTEKKDIVILKGGENIYLVVDNIDIKKLRKFQLDGHCLQQNDDSFKLTPPDFYIPDYRRDKNG